MISKIKNFLTLIFLIGLAGLATVIFTATLIYPTLPLSSSQLSKPSKKFSPASWWNPGTVTKGYYRGHVDAYALQILVDEDNSRIYISEMD